MEQHHSPLRDLREYLGWSQAQLAEVIDVNKSRIGHVENGRGTFRAERWKAIYRQFRREITALGYTFETFVSERRAT